MGFKSAERARFFRAFGELIASGISPVRAVEVLSRTASGSQKRLCIALDKGIRSGHALGDLLWEVRDTLGAMEAGVLRASERTGRVEQACELLARYHESLAAARDAVVRKIAYPVFLLHFGILVLAAPDWVTRGPRAYLEGTGVALIWIYAVALVLFAAGSSVWRGARSSPAAEALVSLVPVAGRVFKNLALGRFAFAFESSLEAGVNVPSALDAAGLASGSASLMGGAKRMLPDIRSGMAVAEAMRSARGFPPGLIRAFEVGGETGRLDAELRRVRDEAFDRGLAGVDLLSEWFPRLIYIGVVLAMAWRILAAFEGIMGGYRAALDF
jgi:type II secretory pathway component PulF